MNWLQEQAVTFLAIPYISGGLSVAMFPMSDEPWTLGLTVFHLVLVGGWFLMYRHYRAEPDRRIRWFACAVSAGAYLLPIAVAGAFGLLAALS